MIPTFRTIEQIPTNTRIHIYGAGSLGKELFSALKAERPDVVVSGFLDTYADGFYCGIPVVKFSEFSNSNSQKDYDMILIASMHFRDIAMLLEASGVNNYRVAPQPVPEEFIHEFEAFEGLEKQTKKRFSLQWEDRFVQINDKTEKVSFERHYMFHPAWAARVLAKIRPEKHIDISSMLHFAAMVSAFVPVDYYEYRPPSLALDNLTTHAVDLLNLPFEDTSVQSLSCMHVIEHVGLGRYGDPLDYDGDLKAMHELARVLAIGGHLLFVVPMGQPRIMFNGHRIYGFDQICDVFECLELKEFALIPDNARDGDLVKNASPALCNAQFQGCGCFLFVKK